MIKLFEENSNPDLNLLFDNINEKHFYGKISKIPCEWNTRMRTTAGKILYKRNVSSKFNRVARMSFAVDCLTPTIIHLSLPLFKNNDMDIKKITRTMQHEMTHAFLLEHHNESGHSARFQSIMTRITGENINHRCHSYDVEGLRNKKNVFYICACGETSGYRSRMPKRGATYTARCCKGRVTFSKV
tara:strand:+ start:9292 stop:9849 length:558 start_codon:yes stop_codon:yes gene_type:complete